MDFSSITDSSKVLDLKTDTKNAVLHEMIDFIFSRNLLSQDLRSLLTEKIFHREELLSTGIGLNLGIPHTRLKKVEDPIVIIGRAPRGVQDYICMDDTMVKLVIMIILEEGQHKKHVQLLSKIVKSIKEHPGNMAKILASETAPADVCSLIFGE
ncbi:MAG: PTS sugar transporter subunit IIA [Fibrobacterota bacterium]